MLQTVLLAVALGALVYVGTSMWMRYSAAEGTVTERLWASVRGSLTILWSKSLIVLTAGFGFLIEAAGALNDPDLQEKLMALIRPEWVPFIGLGVAVITLLARLRSMPRD